MEDTTTTNLAVDVRLHRRALVEDAFASGRLKPLVLPYCLLGCYILPALWLAIPHAHRPWLYWCRWPLMAFTIVFNADVMLRRSSTNPAFAYAVGLAAAWGIIASSTLLIWTRPQADAARVVRRRRRRRRRVAAPDTADLPERQHEEATTTAVRENGSLRRRSNADATTTTTTTSSSPTAVIRSNDYGLVDLSKDPDYDYVWEPFDPHASLGARLNWAFDLTLNFRYAGWNISIPCLPRPEVTGNVRPAPGAIVDMAPMPVVTTSGYRRSLSDAEFVRNRLRVLLTTYLVLDFLAVFMVKDPYFVLGPDHELFPLSPLPSYLRALPPRAVLAYRQILSLAGVICAIVGVFSVNDLVQYYLLPYVFPSRAQLWTHPSAFGSFQQVLDRGLAGWWGSWWHQTFRLQFSAPAAYLRRNGFTRKGTILGAASVMVVSFAQSGLLHACGSLSSTPPTKPWRAPVFFLMQAAGIMLQYAASAVVTRSWPQRSIPTSLCRASRLVFAVVWLHVTSTVFVDDLATTGLWLLEPVPVSPLRWLGFGHSDDHWLRWTREYFPWWHVDQHWWETGLAM
ncbi:hypothetical protein S40285_01922 [Stachybotrys chlorohalonatus IBT 40285]|uniref:Wax synthase domain-containing protein n=1 Tax=Stachybotrys chlorohalonatus (strain IBT 40285) TaxID=1283841 RepID=A0A084QQS1_STAC4|nr:hypothetical protein S40285_01922 [Stachybotrys chlorohalonata IBT 40285]